MGLVEGIHYNKGSNILISFITKTTKYELVFISIKKVCRF
jgi:hypothetical protein